MVNIGGPNLLRLQLYKHTARKQAPAEPMILSSPMKAPAFDPQESVPPSLSAARMLVSVGRHCWLDQHEWQAVRHTSDHLEFLPQVEGGVTKLREAMANVTDALRSRLNSDQQVFDLLTTHDHPFASIAVHLEAIRQARQR